MLKDEVTRLNRDITDLKKQMIQLTVIDRKISEIEFNKVSTYDFDKFREHIKVEYTLLETTKRIQSQRETDMQELRGTLDHLQS